MVAHALGPGAPSDIRWLREAAEFAALGSECEKDGLQERHVALGARLLIGPERA